MKKYTITFKKKNNNNNNTNL